MAFGPQLHEAVRLAHNEVFKGNWGSEPRDEEGWGYVVNDPRARPDLSAVVLERSSGRVAGYQAAMGGLDAKNIQGVVLGPSRYESKAECSCGYALAPKLAVIRAKAAELFPWALTH